MNFIKLIISGGQSGADLSGNVFATRHEIPTRIYTFEGFKPVEGKDERLLNTFERINIKVKYRNNYVAALNERTEFNVKRADATLIFVQQPIEQTRGSNLTMRLCRLNKKPYLVVHTGFPIQAIKYTREFLLKHKPAILNCAGERFLNKEDVLVILEKVWEKERA